MRAKKIGRLSLWKLWIEEDWANDKKAVFELLYERWVMLCKNDSTLQRAERGSSFSSCNANDSEKQRSYLQERNEQLSFELLLA